MVVSKVAQERLELSRPAGQHSLSVLRLPIPTLGRTTLAKKQEYFFIKIQFQLHGLNLL